MTSWMKIAAAVSITMLLAVLAACGSNDKRSDIDPSDASMDSDSSSDTDTGTDDPDGGPDAG